MKKDDRCRGCRSAILFCTFYSMKHIHECPCINCLVKVVCKTYCGNYVNEKNKLLERNRLKRRYQM